MQIRLNYLVPARFLILCAHLVTLLTVFWMRDNNIKKSLPWFHSYGEFMEKDRQLLITMSISLVLLLFELAGLMTGVSIFVHGQSIYSLVSHGCACILLSFFITNKWEVRSYWWIFCLGSLGPAATEVIIFISVFALKKHI